MCLRKTWAEKSRDYRDVIVFENLRFQNVSWPQENTSPAFSNSSGMKRIFEKFFFREGLAGMVGLTVEIKLRLQNPPALCGRDLKYHCGITQAEHYAEYVYYGLLIIFKLVFFVLIFTRNQRMSGTR